MCALEGRVAPAVANLRLHVAQQELPQGRGLGDLAMHLMVVSDLASLAWIPTLWIRLSYWMCALLDVGFLPGVPLPRVSALAVGVSKGAFVPLHDTVSPSQWGWFIRPNPNHMKVFR